MANNSYRNNSFINIVYLRVISFLVGKKMVIFK